MPRAFPITAALVASGLSAWVAAACGDDYAAEAAPPSDADDGGSDVIEPVEAAPDDAGDASATKAPVTALSFVLRKIFVGDTDRGGASSADAWEAFGRDIDGIASTTAEAGECKPHEGTPADWRVDGPGGLDNSFGKNILATMKPLGAAPTDDANRGIAAGIRAPMVGLEGTGGFFVYSEATDAAPTYAFSEMRLVAAEWTEVGTGAKSKIVNGGVASDGFYESGNLVGPTQFIVFIGNTPSRPLTIRVPSFRMKIAADGLTATEGSISGVVPTEELVAEVKRIAGTIDPSLCSGATVDAFVEQIRRASDIMQDGTQDPTRECDGISIGLGFEMTRVVIGAAAPPQPPPANACP